MNITLHAGEKLYINGAVIRVDRKATIELLNDVTFLLENHVLQADQATTPLRQIYFAVQIMLMDPEATAAATGLSRRLIDAALQAFENPAIIAGLKSTPTPRIGLTAASKSPRPQPTSSTRSPGGTQNAYCFRSNCW